MAADIIEAAKDANIQVIAEGRIAETTLKTISRVLMPAKT